MPSPHSLWLVTAPADSAPEEQLGDLEQALGGGKLGKAVGLQFPEFKTGTLSSLLTLSEQLAKQDPQITQSLTKTVDTIRSLVASPDSSSSATALPTQAERASPLSNHLIIDDGRPYLQYIFPEGPNDQTWQWNRSKYRTADRGLGEIVEGLLKEVQSIENAQRNKGGSYALVKGQLTTALRKKTGNLSIRSLAEVVSAEDFAGTNTSEYLETVLVAVPKTLTKDWDNSYERLTQMVVPRSSTKLAQDDEFVLFGVTIFRRVRDEFAQKCRENKFIVRDFTYDAEAIEQQQKDLAQLEKDEKEQWTDLLRLSRINFSELFQILIHIKVIRAFIESVLRYGLPAAYFAAVIKPDPKQTTKLLTSLSSHLSTGPASSKIKGSKSKKDETDATVAGEYAQLLEGEYLDFVLFEVEGVEGEGEK